ncbi:unnamed protein product [Caretta caretta]
MEIPSPAICATCKTIIGKLQSHYINEERYADTLGLSDKAIPTIYANLVGLKTFELPQITPTELRRAQWKDSDIGPVLEAVEKGKKPISKANFAPGTILLLKEWDRLVIIPDHPDYKGPCAKRTGLTLGIPGDGVEVFAR